MAALLILGSGPDVTAASRWPKAAFAGIVAINNAWAVRPDWDVTIHPEDFPEARRPACLPGQRLVGAGEYVPVQNRFGGFVYAGGTMAFTAAYWALGSAGARVIGVRGCDMVYARAGRTHFYGTGAADPLRDDISLRSLEAKSARAAVVAAMHGVALVNLSDAAQSRLVWPRATPATAAAARPPAYDAGAAQEALAEEARLDYRVPSGRYWEEAARFDAAALDAVDRLWLRAARVEPGLAAVQAVAAE